MDSFGIQNVKFEKAKAMARYRRRRKVTALFRFVEICVFLILISKFSTQFPVTFKLSGEYFRSLSVTLVSPRFVFVVGNLIVVVLFLKAGQISSRDNCINNFEKIDFCAEFTERCGKNLNTVGGEDKKRRNQRFSDESLVVCNSYSSEPRKFRRSHSENLKRKCYSESRPELRLSVTERGRIDVHSSEETAYAEDEMSSDEFRRAVEAFIARQQRFLREEETFVSVEG